MTGTQRPAGAPRTNLVTSTSLLIENRSARACPVELTFMRTSPVCSEYRRTPTDLTSTNAATRYYRAATP